MSAASIFRELGLARTDVTALNKKASKHGKSPSEYIRALIEADLHTEHSFDQILAPVREGFRKSGTTEAQLDALVRKARKPSRRNNGPA